MMSLQGEGLHCHTMVSLLAVLSILITVLVCRHFDKEKSGRLNHQEFKSCLRSLGYDLPMVEEGEPDPEFEAILDTVDPNRWVPAGGSSGSAAAAAA